MSEEVNHLSELEEDSYGRQTEQQNTLNSIRQESADKAKGSKAERGGSGKSGRGCHAGSR